MTKKKFLSSVLSLMMVCGAGMLTLNSCNKDAEEPYWPEDDENTQTPSDEEDPADQEIPGEIDPGEEEPGEDNPNEELPGEDDPNEEMPGEEPGDDPDDNGDDEYDSVPADYKYALSYVALPDGTPQQVKEYTGFTVNFNKDNHTPNFVAWELLNSEASGSVDRNNYSYWVDNSLEGCLNTDYAYSTYKYERGHMCPAADQKWSTTAMYDCMVMSNMCPQLSAVNSGMWATLENKERAWAKRDKAIWIIAGPIYYDTDDLYIGKAKARVPSAFFKAFLYIDTDNPRAIAFVMQNGNNPGSLDGYAMSIDELEELTGYDFFSALPDSIEEKVESTFKYSDWDK